MVGTAFISGKSYNGKQAWRIWRRDNRKHASPNSAQTESVCAGALGIQLAGDASYFGKVVKSLYRGSNKGSGTGGYPQNEPIDEPDGVDL